MVLLKMKFTQQRRVRLAQGLWLLSWLAVMCGTFIFCLGVYLKTELLRRAEVERTTNTNLYGNRGKNVLLEIVNTNTISCVWKLHLCFQAHLTVVKMI